MKKIFFFLFWFILIAFPSSKILLANTVSKTVRIAFEIEPVTALKVVSETGGRMVRLGPLTPKMEAPPRTLEVTVATNVKGRYRVVHEVEGNVMNATGDEFPPEKVLFRVSPGIKGGVSGIPSLTPIPQGEVVIFTSGTDGGADAFQVTYSVDNTELFPAGLYYANIRVDIRTE